jgi:hypothetical protein
MPYLMVHCNINGALRYHGTVISPRTVRANGIDLCYEIFGDAEAEPMVLIMGLGAQMIHWDDDF